MRGKKRIKGMERRRTFIRKEKADTHIVGAEKKMKERSQINSESLVFGWRSKNDER